MQDIAMKQNLSSNLITRKKIKNKGKIKIA